MFKGKESFANWVALGLALTTHGGEYVAEPSGCELHMVRLATTIALRRKYQTPFVIQIPDSGDVDRFPGGSNETSWTVDIVSDSSIASAVGGYGKISLQI